MQGALTKTHFPASLPCSRLPPDCLSASFPSHSWSWAQSSDGPSGVWGCELWVPPLKMLGASAT